MTDLTSAKIQTKLMEELNIKFSKLSFNEMMKEIASDKNRISRKIYRDEDILFAVEQIEGFRKTYPKISVEEIVKMIEEMPQKQIENKPI